MVSLEETLAHIPILSWVLIEDELRQIVASGEDEVVVEAALVGALADAVAIAEGA